MIIGTGGIVKDAHLPAYQKAGFPVVGVFDINAERARAIKEEFGLDRTFESLEETVSQAPLEAVFDIAVPASAISDILPHLPDDAGVLIQKPMGEDLEEARSIRELCHGKRLKAAINFQLRYAPYMLAARSLIEQGAIGEVHDMEVRVTVGLPWNLWTWLEHIPRVEILYHSIHYLDLIRSFLGDPQRVYAKTVKHPKMRNLASTRSNIILDYGDTVRANVTTNHGHEFGLRHQESYVKWEGTKGAIKVRMGLLMNYPKGEPDYFEYCVLEEAKKHPTWQSVPLEGSWYPDAFIGTMASLLRYIEGSSAELATCVDDAYKTMALVEAAYESSARGGIEV
ncbi:Gfo/Idh/MocA family oxidoreductase [Acidobacteria bacterium AH-259-O06]|nr:Gfo/Idh/MocA family oxidoreductase [Acidobacteria bacterium AH-259-O06]